MFGPAGAETLLGAEEGLWETEFGAFRALELSGRVGASWGRARHLPFAVSFV